jgi:UDP-N-acetylglucosamine 2-epimerase (non-hydrolysing)
MKILVVFGTRPEAIKLAPIINAPMPQGMEVISCTTGQHKEMLEQVLNLFDIVPDFKLDVMLPNQRLAPLTSRILDAVSEVVETVTPDLVLVQGDTTTAFAAALAAFYAKVEVGHVEAGLRTNDLHSPFPEEAMRQMVGRIATWHFSPTEQNRANLLSEGIDPSKVFVTGNTVIDALFQVRDLIRSGRKMDQLELAEDIQKELLSERRMVLITGHRRENFGDGIARICQAIASLAERFPDILFIYPVHFNPNVVGPVRRILNNCANVRLISPVDYYTFIYLMERSTLIISDSGGVQEEAPSLKKPVFVTRDTTERTEIVHSGAVKLVGSSIESILHEVSDALTDSSVISRMTSATNPYGDGRSAERIIRLIADKKPLMEKRGPNVAVHRG